MLVSNFYRNPVLSIYIYFVIFNEIEIKYDVWNLTSVTVWTTTCVRSARTSMESTTTPTSLSNSADQSNSDRGAH